MFRVVSPYILSRIFNYFFPRFKNLFFCKFYFHGLTSNKKPVRLGKEGYTNLFNRAEPSPQRAIKNPNKFSRRGLSVLFFMYLPIFNPPDVHNKNYTKPFLNCKKKEIINLVSLP